MAKLIGEVAFTGTIGNLTAYQMRGVKGTILGKKKGPSGHKVKNSPKFENTRKINAEFGGCSSTGKHIRSMLGKLKYLANYNFSGHLNALLKPAQLADTTSKQGQRSVLLSTNPRLLEGFNLNENITFDSIIRNPVSAKLNRDSLSAVLDIPELIPGITFHVPGKFPVYHLEATISVIPDYHYSPPKEYRPKAEYLSSDFKPVHYISDWYSCSEGAPFRKVEMHFPEVPPDNGFSLMLAIGISFGTMVAMNKFEEVKYSGAAKILAMA